MKKKSNIPDLEIGLQQDSPDHQKPGFAKIIKI
jgi:hypothetical protein